MTNFEIAKPFGWYLKEDRQRNLAVFFFLGQEGWALLVERGNRGGFGHAA